MDLPHILMQGNMEETDDPEVLKPCTSTRLRRILYPFKHSKTEVLPSRDSNGSIEKLRVVYDRQSDRFFLREEQDSSRESKIPIKSPLGHQARINSSALKKRSVTFGVQWEDLILPPRSTAKRTGGDVSYNYGDLGVDSTAHEVEDPVATRAQGIPDSAVPQEVPTAQETDKTSLVVQEAQPMELIRTTLPNSSREVTESDRGSVTTLCTPSAENVVTETPIVEAPVKNNDPDIQVSVLVPLTMQSQPVEQQATVVLTDTAIEAPVIQESVGDVGIAEDSPALHVIRDSTLVTMDPLRADAPSTDSSTIDSVVSNVMDEILVAIGVKANENMNLRTQEPSVGTVLSKFTAAVRLLRTLRRYIHKRQACSQTTTLATTTATQGNDQTPTLLSSPGTTPPVIAVVTSGSESVNVGLVKAPESQTKDLATALHLDLSKVVVPYPPQQKSTSPQRKSPKKKLRIKSYTRHFEAAIADVPTTDPPKLTSSCLCIDNQFEQEVRWVGEVVHVQVEIPKNSDADSPPSIPHRNHSNQETRNLMTNVYSLQELARIRPHADGFRHVNKGCTFTPLTSSSESSESEEEQIAKVRLPSSSDDDSDAVEFKRGGHVLFYARHRWFKGTIVRRIKKSWFYDIRAANGSVFEAVQAKRIRLFDGDDEPQYSFEIGDRVLWRPEDTKTSSGRHHTYKARIVSIRRGTSSRNSTTKHYDLELLTSCVVKRIPHHELRPLRHYR